MFRHVVMFRWTEGASAVEVDALAAALRELPSQIPEIRDYRIGPDAGVNEGNFAFVVVADFASLDGYLVYRDHPAHQDVIRDHIRPILAERAAVQYDAGA